MEREPARFGDYGLVGRALSRKRTQIDVAGASATYEAGVDANCMTATRIGTGWALLGPAGLIVGGMSKRDKSKCYIAVECGDGSIDTLEGPRKEERAAREFVAKINMASAYFS